MPLISTDQGGQMNKYLSTTIITTLFLILSGCETVPIEGKNYLRSDRAATQKFPVQIISEPSGAIIEINDNYVGKTPITVELEGWQETRTFFRSHRIVAHPLQAGGYIQYKAFTGFFEPSKTYGDTIPEKIYFNMSLTPAPGKHELKINK